MFNFSILFTSIFIVILLFVSSKYIPNIVERPSETVRKIHNNSMINIGGVSFLSFFIILFYIESFEIKLIVIFSNFFLLLGLIADLNKQFLALSRFVILTFLILIYFFISKGHIMSLTDMDYINGIFNLNLFYPIFFSTLCILISTNSFNIIDGQHGLMLGSGILILYLFRLYIPTEHYDLVLTINGLLIISIILFLINFLSGKIKSGDCGSYFLGFSIGALAIYINKFEYINSFHIACILSYPAFELFFTYIRRLINKRNPFQPDHKHLHSNLFKLLKVSNQIGINKPETLNRATSLIIIFFQILLQGSIYLFIGPELFLTMFFIIFIVYVALYSAIAILLRKYST